ncbi:MAG: hypothetical protein EPN26_04250 [Rhodospirillales bacterium]|nr:MAG: hypothetical protein EPN26_04250 [Rhodospirillales bacterium]
MNYPLPMGEGGEQREPGEGVTRRRFLIGAAGATLALPFARLAQAEEAEVKIETPDNLFCVYVERATGKVVSSKSFVEVNPEIKAGRKAPIPYMAPTQNVSITHAPSVFKQDVTRFAIVDIAKRNAALGAFNALYDSYTPGEYTHHFLLNLADRELTLELGDWALAQASEAQKKAALDFLHRIHTGYNGALITGDARKMAEAVRFYTGREVLRPILFLGQPPETGALATGKHIRLATLDPIRLALAESGAVGGGVSVGVGSGMSQAVSAAAEGATNGVSAVGAAVGASAGVGAGSGGSSSAGDGGAGGGSGSSGSSGASSGGAGGAGGSGGNGGGGH